MSPLVPVLVPVPVQLCEGSTCSCACQHASRGERWVASGSALRVKRFEHLGQRELHTATQRAHMVCSQGRRLGCSSTCLQWTHSSIERRVDNILIQRLLNTYRYTLRFEWMRNCLLRNARKSAPFSEIWRLEVEIPYADRP